MTPQWLEDTVRGFGRQMGLRTLELNDHGAAGIAFDNGLALRLESVPGALMLFVTIAGEAGAEALRSTLAEAQPAAQDGRGRRIRSGCLPSTGERFLAVRIAEREVSVPALETEFRRLWERAARLGRIGG